jgi:hypothetical protein
MFQSVIRMKLVTTLALNPSSRKSNPSPNPLHRLSPSCGATNRRIVRRSLKNLRNSRQKTGGFVPGWFDFPADPGSRGLKHSRTLRTDDGRRTLRRRFGLRQPSTAFPQATVNRAGNFSGTLFPFALPNGQDVTSSKARPGQKVNPPRMLNARFRRAPFHRCGTCPLFTGSAGKTSACRRLHWSRCPGC